MSILTIHFLHGIQKKSTLIVGITIGTLLEVPNLVLPDYDLKIVVAKLTLIY